MFKMKGKCMGSTHYQYGWLLLKGLCLTKRKLVQSLLRNLKLEFGVWLNFKKKKAEQNNLGQHCKESFTHKRQDDAFGERKKGEQQQKSIDQRTEAFSE